jgi:signal transduction histidine kinase
MSKPTDPRAYPALYRLSSLAARTGDPHFALGEMLDVVMTAFGADAGSIALLNPTTGKLETEVQQGVPEAGRFALKPGHGVTGWSVLNARSLLVPDVTVESRYIAVRPSTRCEMAAPMHDEDHIMGVIDLESDRTGGFTPADLALLERLALEATHVVRQLWRIRGLQAKARQLETLLTTGQSLVAKLESQQLFATLTRDARTMLQGRACLLFLHDAAARTIRCAQTDAVGAVMAPAGDLPVAACLSASALHTRKQIAFADIQSPDFKSVADLPADPTLHSALLTPLLYEGEVLGVLAVFLDRVHRFDDDEKRACLTLASLGAVALQNARLYARVFQSEETLRKNEQLTTLGLLAAEIAHEIRNPLTVLKLLHGGLGLDLAPEDPRTTDLRVINEKLDQLEAIVLRVLQFGRAPAALHSRWALADIVNDTLVLIRQKLAQARVRVRFAPPAAPLIVDAHKGQLQQVLLNLLFNSMDAMPDGGELVIALGEDRHATPHAAVLDVTDNGAGIPAGIRERVFDSFLSGRPGGTGLGLAIAKRILESHHGSIHLVTTGPTGTTMRVTLPLAK